MSEQVLFVRETAWQSVVSDVVTFGILGVLPWFNYTFCGGSGWIYAAIALGWGFSIFARAGGKVKRYSPTEARRWLDETYGPESP